ncbi:RHS repeat domain-containing protein [Flavobacterium ardleyense]|uniref:RHS repeat domain-containing protein n=1 Tax=Flavobacterium ardleyense TaxID=2038737 RepID=A0ABW5Z918_9FLAO
MRGERKFSILADHLGTPTHLFSEQGDTIWEGSLDSYGKLRIDKGEIGSCPFRYQGQYEDVETGLYYNRFRYYDPEEGRYISQDPIGLASGEFSFYNYVGDPNGWVDIFGLSGYIGSATTFTDSAGTTLTANGYTDLSHLSNTQLNQLEYMNTHGVGMSPKDKQGNVIVGHHHKQQAEGPIVMLPVKHHDKKDTNPGQHPNGKKKGEGLSAVERREFNNWRK